MDFLMLVNRDNPVDKTYLPQDLVDSESKYRDNMLVNSKVLEAFKGMQREANRFGYKIDIMSAYRSYDYQEKIYNKLVKEKGFNYAFRYIAPAGSSEHQTGLAIDICVYRDDKCYTEHELIDMEELIWVQKNAHRFGFILRYPLDKEDITGYNYEGWHFRYVGNIAGFIYSNGLTLEEYLKRINK